MRLIQPGIEMILIAALLALSARSETPVLDVR